MSDATLVPGTTRRWKLTVPNDGTVMRVYFGKKLLWEDPMSVNGIECMIFKGTDDSNLEYVDLPAGIRFEPIDPTDEFTKESLENYDE